MAWMLPAAIAGSGLLNYLGASKGAKEAEEAAKTQKAYYNQLAQILKAQEAQAKPFRDILYPQFLTALGGKQETYDIPEKGHWEGTSLGRGGVTTDTRRWIVDKPATTGTRWGQATPQETEEALLGLPMYGLRRGPLESQFGMARGAIEAGPATGGTLARQLANLETTRAYGIGTIPGQLYQELLGPGMTIAGGKPELAVQGLGMAAQGAGAMIPYYMQQQQTGIQGMGQAGRDLGQLLYEQYLTKTPTLVPPSMSANFMQPPPFQSWTPASQYYTPANQPLYTGW